MEWPRKLLHTTALLIIAVTFKPARVDGEYLITTPHGWIESGTAELCVHVGNAAAPSGSLNVSATIRDYDIETDEHYNKTILQQVIDLPAGKYEKCHDLVTQEFDSYEVILHLTGNIDGKKINATRRINTRSNNERTFVQTDKYLYKPGEKVQFRVLTITGHKMEVSRKEYPEIWVLTPSNTRIAQWKNVSNTDGLIHLDFQLADEPEEGRYKIKVKGDEREASTSFKVEDFVLPRFEVVITPPKHILQSDNDFTFKVCANYTFGQPVKGNLSFTVNNSERRKCHAQRTTNITIDGCTDVTVLAADMRIIDCQVRRLSATAVVEEEGTGIQLRKSASVHTTSSPVTFKTLYKDESMRPNLPFTIKLRAESADGSPVNGLPMEVCAAEKCNNFTTKADGLFNLVLPDYNSNSVIVKALNCRANTHSAEFREYIEHYFSPSNSSLMIIAPEKKLSCSAKTPQKHVLPIMFSARDTPSASLTVQVVSRGHIQHRSTQEVTLTASDLMNTINPEDLVEPMSDPIPGTVRGMFNLEVELPPTASPTVKVLVWYARADGEVVSDMQELSVEQCLSNNVSLGWSAAKAQPGGTASYTLTGEPNSFCSLGVVDKSSELLAKNPDPINLDALFSFMNRFNIYGSIVNDHDYCTRRIHAERLSASEDGVPRDVVPYYRYHYSNYIDAIHMFSKAGVHVITDLTVETRPCEQDPGASYQNVAFAGFGGGAGAQDLFEAPLAPVNADRLRPESGGDTGAEQSSPRTNFPETWLWDLVLVPETGSKQQEVTLPDTITQWVGKAVCVHPEAGIGLSAKESIIAFTPFFVDLTLPPKVKRGETLPVKMSIFNYHSEPLPVTLNLEDSVEYEILEEVGSPGVRGKRSACVPPNDKAVLTVRVKPSVIADVNLTVSASVDATDLPNCGAGANSPQRTDALIKPIKVEADGFPREKTWTKYICSKDFQTGDDSFETWELALPEVLVEGSARGWVTAMGDLLALSLENLGNLIRMPYGCGEQNMLNFAPNIYILRYLETTQQNTPEAREKLIHYMRRGYQRQLLYQRNDGSYSAFGNADDSGSTWLSAFVLKSFAQARKDILIDEEKLNHTRRWLNEQQDKDGCFISIGKVLHKGMQGGVSNSRTPTPLTAYVMVALIEAGEEKTSQYLTNATKCLTSATSSHPYTMALKAYALALAGHPEAGAAVTELLAAAVDSKNAAYWKLPKGESQATALETAGYAILAMMAHDPATYEPQARKVVKWITTQRNGQGGFYSTQDTVVALQALAAYESHQHQGPTNVQTNVAAEGFQHSFNIKDDNKLLQQLATLPTFPTNVTMNMTGEGCAVMQAVLRYNIPNPEPSDAFDLTVNAITAPDQQCVTKRITACASYRLPNETSNMVVMEVDLISGYIPEKEDLKQLLKDDLNLKRYEVDGSKVNFYVNELTSKDTCVNFRVIRAVDVENVKPGTVVVYDYYKPEFSISETYTLPPNDECR